MRALITAWLVTLSLIAVAAIGLQLSYDGPSVIPPEIPVGSTGNPQAGVKAETPAVTGTPSAGSPKETPGEKAPGTEVKSGQTDPGKPVAAATASQRSILPLAALSESGPYGPLPITSQRRQPWQIYGRSYDRPGERPRIAIVITHLGLRSQSTRDAIDRLPGEITLAFSPYGSDLQHSVNTARSLGHEVLMMVPMEPGNYPTNDPGPHTLLAEAAESENLDKLYYIMSRFQGYVGLVGEMGSKFTSSTAAVRPVMADIQRRGLLYLDAVSSSVSVAAISARNFGVPRALNNRFIDKLASGDQIDLYLKELEDLALATGTAVGMGRASYPVTISRIAVWAGSLADRGLELAPISAVVNRQEID